jgi:hypothetical protein
MGKGSRQPANTTSEVTNKIELDPLQKDVLAGIFPKIEGAFGSPVTLPDQLVAPNNRNTIKGQQQALAFSGGDEANNLIGNAISGTNFGINAAQDIEQNPFLKGAIEAAINPVFTNLQENILPGIDAGAVNAGGVGSSRHGIAQAGAIKGATGQAFDIASIMGNRAFDTAQDTSIKALALTPQAFNLGLAPSIASSAVGQQREDKRQQLLDSNLQRSLFEQTEEQRRIADAAAIAFGHPAAGSSSVATGPGPQGPGRASRLLGSALGGAGIGAEIGGPMGAGIGAAGGALFDIIFG